MNDNKTGHEPLFRVVKRAEKTRNQIFLLRFEAVILSLIAGAVFIACIGYNPIEIYSTIIEGAFRSKMAIQATVKYAIPLTIASLGITLAFKMKFWNIGAEGQIIVGAIFASYFALFHANWNH
ncbi:MAG: ABC transporter permease, partial [Clostridia bacterium]|nr:ABC transporter permease [Clostridia bacterium]